MKIFITGATGFLGQYVVLALAAAGHDCICMYRSCIPERLVALKNVTWVKGELKSDWSTEFKQSDALIHLAAIGVSPQKATQLEYFQVNVMESLMLVEHAVECGIERVVACGSCFEYGASGLKYDFIPVDAPLEPLNTYGASKAAATIALKALAYEKKFSLIILRPFHFYGEGQDQQNLWPALKRAALAGENFEMTLGEQVRDYMSVESVAEAFVSMINTKELGVNNISVHNVGSGTPILIKEFCDFWWNQWSAKGELKIGAIPYRENEVMRYLPEI